MIIRSGIHVSAHLIFGVMMKSCTILICLFFLRPAYSQDDQLRTDWANLKRYAQENAELMAEPLRGDRVVFMGNSITEGWKKKDSTFFLEHPYIDRGISGQTSPQMLVRFRPDVIALKPATVVILAGTNDVAQNTGPISNHDILGNIISMTQLAQANGIKVILCSVLPANDFPWRRGLQPADKIVALNTMIKEFCDRNHVTYVDYYSALVDEQKGLDRKFSDDGVHPTLDGYRIMEPLIEQAIGEIGKR
jgi:lysophospholipase L1-like esterase